MRIAVISPATPPGATGDDVHGDSLARALAHRGHEVHLLTPGRSRLSTEIIDGVEIHHVPELARHAGDLRRTWAVARTLRRLGSFDVVQAPVGGGQAWWYSLRHGSRLVTQLTTADLEAGRGCPGGQLACRARSVRHWLERSQARRSALVVCPLSALAAELSRRWHVPAPAMAVIPPGVTAPRIDDRLVPASLRDVPYALFLDFPGAGRSRSVWMEAVAEILERSPHLHVVFSLDRSERPPATAFDALRGGVPGPPDRLHVVRTISTGQHWAVVRGARVVVMAGHSSAALGACVTAMALGRPVVAARGAGLDEVIRDSVDGFIVPADSAPDLASLIGARLSDPESLTRVGLAAARRASELGVEPMVELLLHRYERLAARFAPVPAAPPR